MTIATTAAAVSYVGNGVTTEFDFAFPVPAGALAVYLTEADVVTRVPSGRYTATGVGGDAGGRVTFAIPPTVGQTVTLRREVAMSQDVALVTGTAFYAEVVEGALDRLTMIAQQMAEDLARTVKVPIGSAFDESAYLDRAAALADEARAARDTIITALGLGTPSFILPGRYGGTGGITAGHERQYPRVNAIGSAFEYLSAAQVFADLTGFAGWRGLTWTRASVTTPSYAVSNADKGKTLAASGGLLSVNFGTTTAGFDADFVVLVVNEDTGRGKNVTINGVGFTLWPGQSMLFWVGTPGGAWRMSEQRRWKLERDVTLYVNPSSGSDTSGYDGLVPGAAFRTINAAYKVASQYFDIGGKWAVTVKLADGTYTESLVVSGHLTGRHLIFIEGNTSAPQNVLWYAGSDGYCIFATDYGCAIVKGIAFSAVTKVCLQSTQSAILDIAYPTLFSSSDGGVHIVVSDGGHFNILGTYAIVGNAASHIQVKNNGRLSLGGGFSVDIGQPVNVGYFLNVTDGGIVSTNGLAVTYTNAGNCSGYRYSVYGNGVVRSTGTTFPGSAAGVTGSGGQYL